MARDRFCCPVCATRAGFQELGGGAVRCPKCGLGCETILRISAIDYRRDVYDERRDEGAGDNRWARFLHDSAVAEDRLEQFDVASRFGPMGAADPRAWLDIGCGNAALLAVLRRQGWDVRGVEADEKTCQGITQLLGIRAFPFIELEAILNTAPTQTRGPFSVASFIDTLEHFLDPLAVLGLAVRAVKRGGLVIVEAPDLDDAGSSFTTWKHRRNKEFTEHIWHFSPTTMEFIRQTRFPTMAAVHVAKPMAGRFQVIWRNEADASPSADEKSLSFTTETIESH